jgi:hypothetical protein
VNEVVLTAVIKVGDEAEAVTVRDAKHSVTDTGIRLRITIHFVRLAAIITVAVGVLVLVLGLLMLIGIIVPEDVIDEIAMLVRMISHGMPIIRGVVGMADEGEVVAQREPRADPPHHN